MTGDSRTLAPLHTRTPNAEARLRNDVNLPEILAAKLWAEVNEPPSAMKPAQPPLEHLFNELPGGITKRDVSVASTLFQWLTGTHVGTGLLRLHKKRLAEAGYDMF